MNSARRSTLSTAIHILLAVLVLPFLVLLFQNFLRAYFVIEGAATITQDEVTTFDVLAIVGVVMTVAPAIWGLVRRRWIWGLVHLATLGIVLVAILILAVPHDAFRPQPQEHHLPSNYTPCYSGSGTCPGG